MIRASRRVIILRYIVLPILVFGVGLLAIGMYVGWGRKAAMDALSWMPKWR